MTKLRFWIAVTLGWLLLMYNIERYDETVNIASFVYILAAVLAITVVGLQRWCRLRLVVLLVLAALSWAICKAILRGPVFHPSWLIVAAELAAVLVTTALAWRISLSIEEFEAGAFDVIAMRPNDRAVPLSAGRGDLERELRRAEQFHRPLALLRLETDAAINSISLNGLIQEVQRGALQQHLSGQLAQLISDTTRDCDLVAQNRDHFVVLLPETDRQQALEMIEQMQRRARRQWGFDLRVGVAEFPAEEVTLTGLLDRAAHGIRAERQRRSAERTAAES